MQVLALEGGRTRAAVRRKVLLRGRMRVPTGTYEVCVRDVSPRGMLLQAVNPPRRGMVIEVAVSGRTILARVIWATERRFGVMTRDTVPVAALCGDVAAAVADEAPRRRAKPPQLPTHEKSRHAGRFAQFAAVGLLCAGGGAGLAWGLHEVLTVMVDGVALGLRGS